MDLRQLRYFAVLAEEKHFGRAAQRLSLSQPPLSHAIRQLEEELGAPLFARTSRHVALTPAGVALQREAQALLQRAEEARTLVQEIAAGRRGRLRVGFAGSMLYRALPQILRDFHARAPGIEIVLRELNSAEQVAALHHDEIDIGFIHARAAPAGLEGFAYHAEPFVACLPAGHVEAVRADGRRRVRLSKLEHEAFVLFSRKVSPDYYESIIATCLDAGFLPQVKYEVRHWFSVVSLVAQGMGVALVPRSLAKSRLAGAAFVPIPEGKVLSETWCVWRAAGTDPPTLDQFLAVVRSYVGRVETSSAPSRR
ncbi:MAG TPA: LysR substrate-binding domain-containing protein [Stellaceae bacterium]